MFDFLFMCQFAENDGFQVHPCPYKGQHMHFLGFYEEIFFSVYFLLLFDLLAEPCVTLYASL